jgi:hypothetical protein
MITPDATIHIDLGLFVVYHPSAFAGSKEVIVERRFSMDFETMRVERERLFELTTDRVQSLSWRPNCRVERGSRIRRATFQGLMPGNERKK